MSTSMARISKITRYMKLGQKKQLGVQDERNSHLTILDPRDSYASSRMMTDLGEVVEHADKEKFKNRRQFFFATLAFCIGLGNIWRFPRQLLLFGDATYVYLYVFFSFTIGIVVLFFEVALGQYSSKGFMNVFAMCPVFEGISYAMTMYCTVGNIFYNMVNVYNLRYMFTVFAHRMPHDCDNFTVCRSPDLPQSLSTEYKFFTDLNEHGTFSWKNAFALLLVWVVIFFGVITKITKLFWVPMSVVIIVVVALIFTFFACISVNGANKGLSLVFVPETFVLKSIDTWLLPFQQCLVSMGVGMGPIINFGSYSRFKSLAHIDCIIITTIAVFCSILAAGIIFSSAGVIAQERSKSIQDALWTENKIEDFQVHIIFTQLCNRLTFGLGHFTLIVFYLALMFTSFFTAIEFTSAFLALIEDIVFLNKPNRIRVTATICIVCFGLGTGMVGGSGLKFMAAMDTIFIATSPIIIIICEMIAVIYIYGMTNYCDDIEFMLGFVPNYYFQIQWLLLPVFSAVFLGICLYKISREKLGTQDMVLLFGIAVIIVLPMIIKAICNCVLVRKDNQPLVTVLHPREVINVESGESNASAYSYKNKDAASSSAASSRVK